MGQVPVGQSGAPFRMVVEEGKVREFAVATKSSHPEHHRDHDPMSPVTFLMAARFWQTPESDAWGDTERNYERILHGEQEFVFQGPPPRAGTELVGVQRIDKVYEKEGRRGGTMTFTEVLTEFRDTAGNLVAEVRATSIETSKPPTEGDA